MLQHLRQKCTLAVQHRSRNPASAIFSKCANAWSTADVQVGKDYQALAVSELGTQAADHKYIPRQIHQPGTCYRSLEKRGQNHLHCEMA
jgi:hypothetical protein